MEPEVITESNIDRNKLFDNGNFLYYDENGNIQQYILSAAFGIDSDDVYRALMKHIANYGRVYIGKLLIGDNEISINDVPNPIPAELVVGKETIIKTNLFPDRNNHFYVEFAVAYDKINKLESGTDLFLFYFVDDIIDGEMIKVSAFKYIY